MNKKKPKLPACIAVIVVMLYLTTNANVSGRDYLSPSELVADKQAGKLYIAQTRSQQVAVFDIAAGKVTRTYSLSGSPSGLALAADRSRLYVTCALT